MAKKKLSPEFIERIWKPGQSGNPKGKAKGVTISDAYRKILAMKMPPGKDMNASFKEVLMRLVEDGATVAEFVALAQMREAFKGKTAAAAEVTDRIEGKAPSTQRIEGASGDQVVIRLVQADGPEKE